MFLNCNGLLTHCQISGAGEAVPLVLLHSLGTNLHVWDKQVNLLEQDRKVVRLDLRGHGLTDVPAGPYTLEQVSADILDALTNLSIERFHLGGISVGGMAAQAIAAAAPARVASLVLCSTSLKNGAPQMWRDRARKVRTDGIEPIADAVIERWVTPTFSQDSETRGLRNMLLRTAPEGYAGGCDLLAESDCTAATSSLLVPTLILVGEHDTATPPAAAQLLHNAIASSQLRLVPGAAHIPLIQEPDAVSDWIHDFLQPLG